MEAVAALETTFPGQLFTAGQIEFETEVKSFWSTTVQELRPLAILFPETAGDVS